MVSSANPSRIFPGIRLFFGRELKVYKFEKLANTERTTDWELIYSFYGSKIFFSAGHIHIGEFSPFSAGNSFSAKELKAMMN